MPRNDRHEVIVVGAGPTGLTAAIDLLLRGIDVILLEAGSSTAEGSRAICFSKRTLEVFSRIGASEQMLEKGVSWKKGKVFHGDALVYEFDLLPEPGHSHPAFINLQQYYVEQFLQERLAELDPDCLRQGHEVIEVENRADGALVKVRTDTAEKDFEARYVLACDGAKSGIRDASGLEFVGEVFRDRFLICDIKMKSDFPSERWFWFDPPFHAGNSALLHKQPDDVWRIDLQLGWHADAELEQVPERIIPRLRAMLGDKVEFELEWTSLYAFQSRRMKSFIHGRIFFAGDAAHQVSPFGARGANSSVQDVDNLCWKLAHVLRHGASVDLLATYDSERLQAADSNIRHSSESTHFIAPQNNAARGFRDAALELAGEKPQLRSFVNSGRLSTAHSYENTELNGDDDFAAKAGRVGSFCPDAPIKVGAEDGWLLDQLGEGYTVLVFADPAEEANGVSESDRSVALRTRYVSDKPSETCFADSERLMEERFGVEPGAAVLLRPDGHISARLKKAKGNCPLERAAAIADRITKTGRAS